MDRSGHTQVQYASHLGGMATTNVIPRDGLTEYVISGSTKGEVAEGVYRIRRSYHGCRITEDPPIMATRPRKRFARCACFSARRAP